MLTDRKERIILNWLNDNFDKADCFKPDVIYGSLASKLTSQDNIAGMCRRLHAKKLIDEISGHSSDPEKIHSCYRISQLGIDELNPNTRDKQMFKLAKVGAAAGIIAAITSIIAVIVILVG